MPTQNIFVTGFTVGEEELSGKVSTAGQRQTASQQTDRIPVLVMDDQMSTRFLRRHELMPKIAALLSA